MEVGTAHEFNLTRGDEGKDIQPEETKEWSEEQISNAKGKDKKDKKSKKEKPKKEVISAFG